MLCMIFREKCFSCYILLTDQISFSDCLYFLRFINKLDQCCIFEKYINVTISATNIKNLSNKNLNFEYPLRKILLTNWISPNAGKCELE